MRWRIHGSDPSDGSSVLLDIEADSAAAAVAGAHDRQIVVAHVTRTETEPWRKAAFVLAVLAAIAFAASTAFLYKELAPALRAATESRQEAQNAISDLQNARTDLSAAQTRLQFLEGSLTDRERQREQTAAAIVAKLTTVEQSLQTTQQNAAALEQAVRSAEQNVVRLTAQLASAEAQRQSLEKTLADLRQERTHTQEDLATAIARAADAESRAAGIASRSGELTVQLRQAEGTAATLKTQLEELQQANEAASRHALALSYDQALDFVALEFGKPLVEAARETASQITVSAAQAEHANTFVMHTDKQRVFDATLQVCLAADAPKEVINDNRATLAKFLSTFAPQWKSPDDFLISAFKQTAGRGDAEHSVLTTENYRISVSGNKLGQYSIRIEPASADGRGI